MIEQLNLSPLATPIGVAFPENGSEFFNLGEKEFLQKAPQVSTACLFKSALAYSKEIKLKPRKNLAKKSACST